MKYDKVMMDTAVLWSKQTKCKKRRVGAVIAKDGRIISIGYNGTVQNSDNECEEGLVKLHCCGIDISETKFVERYPYKEDIENTVVTICPKCSSACEYTGDEFNESLFYKTKLEVIHAEENALIFAAKYGISVEGCTMYITTMPCIKCSALIVQAGIKRVVYKEDYKNHEGIDLLIKHHIEVNKI